MKNFKIYIGALLMVLFATVSSCDEVGDIEVGGTVIEDMAGDWWVDISHGEDHYGYYRVSTYNSAADIEEMWLDDHGDFWEFKVRMPVSISNLTFSGTDLTNEYYDSSVTVQNGFIVENVADATTGGNTTDTISFDIIFSDGGSDPWEFRGYRRTGFPEDEH